jgi:hypothetical protein
MGITDNGVNSPRRHEITILNMCALNNRALKHVRPKLIKL